MIHPYRICPKCQTSLTGLEAFCSKCGTDLIKKTSSGSFLQTTGIIVGILVGLYGLINALGTANILYGFNGVACGFILSPIAVAIVPIYWLLNGFWWPAIIIYGGGLLATILYNSGKK